MVYTSSYKPAYYNSIHDSIASICKSILPFGRRKRLTAIAAAEQRLSEQQSDNLKWQQEKFHQILKLIGLSKEGILEESEVSAFRADLLGNLTATVMDHEAEVILRDKLVFLQELLYAQCISEEEYHSAKRPLLDRLVAQGAIIRPKDVILPTPKQPSEEEWSVIDLKDSNSKSKAKTKGPISVFGYGSSNQKNKDEKRKPNELSVSRENPFWNSQLIEKDNESRSILMTESLPVMIESKNEGEKSKKKMFRTLFQKEGNENGDYAKKSEEKGSKSEKKQWGFKKWKRNESEDETAPLPLSERSDNEAFSISKELFANPTGEEEKPNKNNTDRNLNSTSATNFPVDKVLADKIKKELSRLQAKLNANNSTIEFSDDQIEIISTRLPVDKVDLKNTFSKLWCDRYGDAVLDVVRKEFTEHVAEKEYIQTPEKEKKVNLKRWETFDDDENCHPNLFASRENPFPIKQSRYNDPLYKSFKNNPFFPDYEENDYEDYQPKTESVIIKDQNPFWAH